MAFPASPSNNQVHKEGNRAFVWDSTLGVWDQVRETDRTENKILSDLYHGEIGSDVTGGAGLVPRAPLSHRNMIINGAMQIDQRFAGALSSGVGAGDDNYSTVDRYRNTLNIGGARLSFQQADITDLAEFSQALKIDCTEALDSNQMASGQYVQMHHRIEGLNLQQMEKGYPSAKPVTLSFWVKGTQKTEAAGSGRKYVVELRDSISPTRTATYEFVVTTSWVKHEATFPGDTDIDTKIPNDNTVGLNVIFWLAAGTNYTSGTYTATTWADWVAANAATGLGANNGKGLMQDVSSELYITGLQLELGSTATPFEHRSYGEELARCQRYAVRFGGVTAYDWLGTGGYNSSGNKCHVTLPQMMRAVPIVESTGVVTRWAASTDAAAGGSVSSIVKAGSVHDLNHITLDVAFSGGSNGQVWNVLGNNNSSAKIIIAAEL